MVIVCELDILPVRKDSMSNGIVKALEALEDFDVSYETNPMGTVIEAEDIDTLFEALKAAHKAVDEERVITSIEIDDKKTNPHENAREKVKSVEKLLGKKPKKKR